MSAAVAVLPRPRLAGDGEEHAFGPYEALRVPGRAGGTILAFSSLGVPPSRIEQWEFKGQLRQLFPDWQLVFVRDQSRSWFNADAAALERLLDWLDEVFAAGPGPRRVVMGSSVGGFGALLFAGRLGADTCVALSPQVELGREKVRGSDTRWMRFLERYSEPAHTGVSAAEGCRYHVLYPSLDLLDTWQVAQLPALEHAEYYGWSVNEHNCAAELKKQGLLPGFLQEVVSTPDRRATLANASAAKPDLGARTMKELLVSLRAAVSEGMRLSDWCRSLGLDAALMPLMFQFWSLASGAALRDEDVAAFSDEVLLKVLERLPTDALAQRLATRQNAAAWRSEPAPTSGGWLSAWQQWRPADASLGRILLSGWNAPEVWGVWSAGSVSQLMLPVRLVPGRRYRLRLRTRLPWGRSEVRLRVTAHFGPETVLDERHDVDGPGELLFRFFAPAVVAQHLVVTLVIGTPACPLLDHPTSPDFRSCGLGLEAVSIGSD